MEEPSFNRGNESGASAERKDLTLDSESFRKDLSLLLYRPQQPRLDEAIESSLSVIPWNLCLEDESSSSAFQQAEPLSNFSKPTTIQALSFPSASYLDLRRNQNLKFADDQSSKANPSAWKQALQLVPDHIPSLVGYGNFFLQNNKLEQAEKLLKDALSMDPNHSLARRLLSELNEKRHQTNRHQPYTTTASRLPNHITSKPNLKTRESSAYQDALLERQLLASPRDDRSTNEEEEESLDRKHHKKSRRHHKKRKKERKRRRKHYDSSSENASEDSLDESDEEKRRRKRKKRKREHKREERRRNHRKHRRRSKSDSSAS